MKKCNPSHGQNGQLVHWWVLWYNVGLTQGQEPDEEMQPIPWTERPTGALVGAGSLWSVSSTSAPSEVLKPSHTCPYPL